VKACKYDGEKNEKIYHGLRYSDGEFLIKKWKISVVFHGMGRQGLVCGIL